MHINSKFQISSLTTLRSVDLRFRLRLNLLNWQLRTWNLKPLIIKYLTLITIISILLVLPATMIRASWVGAIAGSMVVLQYKYHYLQHVKQFLSSPFRRILAMTLTIVIVALMGTGIYFLKKDSFWRVHSCLSSVCIFVFWESQTE